MLFRSENLLTEVLAREVRSLKPYQNSQSSGTLEDGLVVLRYLEGAYGRSAIPEAIVLGISTRFVADYRTIPSPLWSGINKYSPHFRLLLGSHPPELTPRSMTRGADVQVHIRPRNRQIVEKHLRQFVVVMLAGMDNGGRETAAIFRQFRGDRRDFHVSGHSISLIT